MYSGGNRRWVPLTCKKKYSEKRFSCEDLTTSVGMGANIKVTGMLVVSGLWGDF